MSKLINARLSILNATLNKRKRFTVTNFILNMCVASLQRWRIYHNVVTSEKTEWPKQKGETWDDCEKQIQEVTAGQA